MLEACLKIIHYVILIASPSFPLYFPEHSFNRLGTLQLISFISFLLVNSLYSKGRVLGYERAKRNQNPNVSLIQIEGCQTSKDAQFYLGKRVAYVYRAQREVNGSKIRVIWGRIARSHGTSGVVKARFRKNLPPKTFGASVRVMLYPSNI
ncbi:ribosomal protein L35Ae-domain-containing protein [Mycotypha africana]|uniref:ribosomal protein L35Ae-domain-containing protein n=1 Tax=Mycotypha africana TaxID=64632 RepID=UPI0023019562|nr:ribosomal protein L35Ae-domain-containing protein [Mycotypha africana]KAI8971745.1 ribosomal protein L35Ae-domain-containing protein [Mycotypha africana]